MRNTAQYGTELESVQRADQKCAAVLASHRDQPWAEQQEICENIGNTWREDDKKCQDLPINECEKKDTCVKVADALDFNDYRGAPQLEGARGAQCRARAAEDVLWAKYFPMDIKSPLGMGDTAESKALTRDMYTYLNQPSPYELEKGNETLRESSPAVQFMGMHLIEVEEADKDNMRGGGTLIRIRVPRFASIRLGYEYNAGDTSEEWQNLAQVVQTEVFKEILDDAIEHNKSSAGNVTADECIRWFQGWIREWGKQIEEGKYDKAKKKEPWDSKKWALMDQALRKFVYTTARKRIRRYMKPRVKHGTSDKTCLFLQGRCLSVRGLQWGTHRVTPRDSGTDPSAAAYPLRVESEDVGENDALPERVYAYLDYLYGSRHARRKLSQMETESHTQQLATAPVADALNEAYARVTPNVIKKYAQMTDQQLNAQEASIVQEYDELYHVNDKQQVKQTTFSALYEKLKKKICTETITPACKDQHTGEPDDDCQAMTKCGEVPPRLKLLHRLKPVLSHFHKSISRIKEETAQLNESIDAFITQHLSSGTDTSGIDTSDNIKDLTNTWILTSDYTSTAWSILKWGSTYWVDSGTGTGFKKRRESGGDEYKEDARQPILKLLHSSEGNRDAVRQWAYTVSKDSNDIALIIHEVQKENQDNKNMQVVKCVWRPKFSGSSTYEIDETQDVDVMSTEDIEKAWEKTEMYKQSVEGLPPFEFAC